MMSKICPPTSSPLIYLNRNPSALSQTTTHHQFLPIPAGRTTGSGVGGRMKVSCRASSSASASASSVVKRRRGEEEESLYQLLGITPESGSNSSFQDIKKAYKEMARKYHPDVAPADRVDEHTHRFILVKKAYDTLSNPQKRAIYDNRINDHATTTYNNYSDQEIRWRRNWEHQLEHLHTRTRTNTHSWASRIRQSTPASSTS